MEGIVIAIIGYVVVSALRSLAKKSVQGRPTAAARRPANGEGGFAQIFEQLELTPPDEAMEGFAPGGWAGSPRFEPEAIESGEGDGRVRYVTTEGAEQPDHDHGGALASVHVSAPDAPAPRAAAPTRVNRSQMRQAVVMAEVLGPSASRRRRNAR